jgi:hypothetical protein
VGKKLAHTPPSADRQSYSPTKAPPRALEQGLEDTFLLLKTLKISILQIIHSGSQPPSRRISGAESQTDLEAKQSQSKACA